MEKSLKMEINYQGILLSKIRKWKGRSEKIDIFSFFFVKFDF